MANENLKGMDELLSKLNSLHSAMAIKLLRSATGFAMTPVIANAKMRIPVGKENHLSYKGNLLQPGFARDSIRKATFIKDGRAVASVGVRKEAFYAVQFVEVGTSKMDAKEWLVPALEATRGEVERRLTKSLRKKVEKAIK